eukprot:14361507-Heterocapsa_arctica.AAC.1
MFSHFILQPELLDLQMTQPAKASTRSNGNSCRRVGVQMQLRLHAQLVAQGLCQFCFRHAEGHGHKLGFAQ